MARCDIIPLTSKACSGKCKGGGCTQESTLWVLAVCEGMAALFSKQPNGHLKPLEGKGCESTAFVDGMREHLAHAAEDGAFSQLVLVGSANDLAWGQASLPAAASKRVIAEIEYPLIAGWFHRMDRGKLTRALDHVFEA